MPHPVRDILAASAAVDYRLRRHPAVRPDGCGLARRHGRIRRLAQPIIRVCAGSSGRKTCQRRTRPRRRGISSEKCAAPTKSQSSQTASKSTYLPRASPSRASFAWRPMATCSSPKAARGVSACCGRAATARRSRARSHRACAIRSASRSIRPAPIRNGSMSAIPMPWSASPIAMAISRRAARPRSWCRICRSAATAPATWCSRRTARQCMCRSAPPRTSAKAWRS